MKRYGPGWGWSKLPAQERARRHHVGFRSPIGSELCEGEGDGGGGGGGGGTKDAAYWEAEAKKAFAARDGAKSELKKLTEAGLVLTPEQKDRLAQLEDAAAKAEEEKRKAAGDFESWRKDITGKHADEVKKHVETLTSLQREIADDKIQAAFGAATDFFGGGENSKSILTPTLAFKTFREYVSFEEFDFGADDGGKRKVIVVRDTKNKIIRGDGGHPAPFAEAIGRLIDSHPDKDHILRGSGKAGSGSSGGGDRRSNPDDLETMTRKAAKGDQAAVKALQDRRRGGAIISGSAWEGRGASK